MQNATAPTASPVVCHVIGTASMEALVNGLSDALPAVQLAFHPMGDLTVESQQLEEEDRKKRLEEIERQLKELQPNDVKTTGPLQLFLLDSQGVAAGDPSSQAALRALAKAALTDPSNTVAALVSEKPAKVDEEPGSQGLQASIESSVSSFLQDCNVQLLQDRQAIVDYLTSR